MQKFQLFVIGIGFFWIFVWSLFGTLLGAQIHKFTSIGVPLTFNRDLLRSVHAHMNVMGITTILIGFSLSYLKNALSEKGIKKIIVLNLLSILMFGIGLLLESFHSLSIEKNFPLVLSAMGGIFYLLTTVTWSALFIFTALKKNN